MTIPLFLETSKGMINLALVSHIFSHSSSKELIFQFVGESYAVHFPEAEGKFLMRKIKETLGGYTK
jgi:hypothetical protein